MHILGSSVGGWLPYLPCSSSLLMILVHNSLAGEWLLCLAAFSAVWWCLSFPFQLVSDYHCFCISSILMVPVLPSQLVGGHCALLCFKPDNNAYSLLFRQWVTSMPYCVSSLLLMPLPWFLVGMLLPGYCLSTLLMKSVFISLVCEWLSNWLCFKTHETCVDL